MDDVQDNKAMMKEEMRDTKAAGKTEEGKMSGREQEKA